MVFVKVYLYYLLYSSTWNCHIMLVWYWMISMGSEISDRHSLWFTFIGRYSTVSNNFIWDWNYLLIYITILHSTKFIAEATRVLWKYLPFQSHMTNHQPTSSVQQLQHLKQPCSLAFQIRSISTHLAIFVNSIYFVDHYFEFWGYQHKLKHAIVKQKYLSKEIENGKSWTSESSWFMFCPFQLDVQECFWTYSNMFKNFQVCPRGEF